MVKKWRHKDGLKMVSTFRFLILFYNSQKLPGRRKEPPSYQCEQSWQLVSQLKIKEGIIYTDLFSLKADVFVTLS